MTTRRDFSRKTRQVQLGFILRWNDNIDMDLKKQAVRFWLDSCGLQNAADKMWKRKLLPIITKINTRKGFATSLLRNLLSTSTLRHARNMQADHNNAATGSRQVRKALASHNRRLCDFAFLCGQCTFNRSGGWGGRAHCWTRCLREVLAQSLHQAGTKNVFKKKAEDGDTWQGTEIWCSVFSYTELAIFVGQSTFASLTHSLTIKINYTSIYVHVSPT